MLEGQTIDAAALRKRLSNHVSKLNAGQSTTQVQLPPAFMVAWTSAIEKNDTEALRELHKQRQAIVEAVRAKDPPLLHQRRQRAQYVDLNPGGTWSLPSETLRSDAQSLGLIVASELSGFLQMAPDDQFAVAFALSGESLPSDTEYDERVILPLLTE